MKAEAILCPRGMIGRMEKPPKVARLDDNAAVRVANNDGTEAVCSSTITSFENFRVHQLLNVNTKLKSFAVCGSFAGRDSSSRAVVLAEKEPLTSDSLSGLFSSSTRLTNNFQNDIYGQATAVAGGGLGNVKLTTIYPATDEHIQKYSDQDCFMVRETPEDYEKVTRGYIESQSLSSEVGRTLLVGGVICLAARMSVLKTMSVHDQV